MNADFFEPLINWVSQDPWLIFWAILFTAFVESLALAGIIVPGVLLLFLIAAVAGGMGMSAEWVLLAGFIGAVAGDGISFLIGYYFKDRLPGVWPFTRYPKAMATGERYFHRHGGKSVVLGRFVGPIRPVMPLIAGMMGMTPTRFFTFNLLSALAWAPFYHIPGYLTGTATHVIVPERFYTVLSVMVLLLFACAMLFRWLSLKLQKGSDWYEALAQRRHDSPRFRKFWIMLTRHQRGPSEFPLASVCLFGITTILFIVWTLLVFHAPALRHLDQIILELSNALGQTSYRGILIALTMIGDEGLLYCTFALFIIVMLAQGRPMAAIHLTAAGLATAILTHTLKFGFALPRPDQAAQAFVSYAYPSGHTSGATVLFGLVAAFLAQRVEHMRRWMVYCAFAAPIILIALTRLLLGVHWLSDIIGGALLGLMICAATRVSYSRYTIWQRDKRRLKDNWILASGVFAWMLCLLVYWYWRYDAVQVKYSGLTL